MHSGTATMDRDGRFDGMVNGALIVAPGISVTIAGMVNGGLVVGAGADVVVSGMVKGGITNNGGQVTVTGMVTD